MLSFVFAVIALIITPGPGVLSLAGVGSAYGYRHGARYLIGLLLGNNMVCIAVITGLAAVMLAEPRLRLVFSVASTAYLLWLAYRIAFAGAKVGFIDMPAPPGIRGGILLQAINPKAYVVNTVLFSGFAFLPGSPGLEMALKLVIWNVLWILVHILWLWVGVSIRALNLPARTQRAINIGMALAMLAVVALAIFSAS
ncbi:MAG: LysE family transporter [Silicimonas sp.]|nr:LysE family transporter [Silicimonas sp.]